ncbi:hypothetical protein H0H93_009980, partial [Arthromyces matolae]
LDGSVFHRPVAAFRLLPYLARRHIDLPDMPLDVPMEKLKELEETDLVDDDDLPDVDEDN